MIIIGFTHKTSKVLPRIFCRRFRHVAIIVPDKKNMVMFQFVRCGNIVKIRLNMRDIKLLGRHGWRFVWVTGTPPHDFEKMRALTCVQMAKNAIDLRDFYIQTPDALYKKVRLF